MLIFLFCRNILCSCTISPLMSISLFSFCAVLYIVYIIYLNCHMFPSSFQFCYWLLVLSNLLLANQNPGRSCQWCLLLICRRYRILLCQMCCIPKIPPKKIESTKVALVNKVHVIIFFLSKYMYHFSCV